MVQISATPVDRFSLPKIRPSLIIGIALLILCMSTLYSVTLLRNDARSDSRFSKSVEIRKDREVLSLSAGSGSSKIGIETVAYLISITGCGSETLAEGAAVLKHSIHLTSARGTLGGKYDYRMIAIYHPEATSCVQPLSELGYELVKRDTPVALEEIDGDFLRRKIVENGCCGEKELIKLEAYTFTEFKVVVHVDLDVLILKPLDVLFDAMLQNDPALHEKEIKSNVAVMWPDRPLPKTINAFFTRDYGMVTGKRKYKPVQGGFLVLRPDLKVYDEFVAIIKKGDFQEGKGWGGMRVGPFYGSQTVQGILPYYYDILHPGESVDLNRCVYDQMCDNPREQKTVNDVAHGNCRTGEEQCEDCRNRPLEDIASVHFTVCQKPWNCLPHSKDMIQHRLCRKLHHEWYRIRSDMEKAWGREGTGDAPEWKEKMHFFGYCTKPGQKGYLPIAKPYGRPSS